MTKKGVQMGKNAVILMKMKSGAFPGKTGEQTGGAASGSGRPFCLHRIAAG